MNPNNYKEQKLRGLKRKLEAIEIKGGSCIKCGYNKNISALDFHHIEPDKKNYQLDVRHFSNTSIEKLEIELKKCILLCSNCHREEHNPSLNLTIVKNSIEIKKINKVSFKDKCGRKCNVCDNRFLKSKGKLFCSEKCRNNNKNYPSIQEITEQHEILKSWQKVADFFNITRKITQTIRNNG